MKACPTKRHLVLASIGLGLSLNGCAPPSLRAAHSMEQGKFAVEAGASLGLGGVQATALTLTGDEQIGLKQSVIPDLRVMVGLGYGIELGAGTTFAAKYSILDERRHKTPISIAVGAEYMWLEDVSVGLMTSSHIQMGKSVAFRPIANAYFSNRVFQVRTPLEGDLVDEEGLTEEEGLKDDPQPMLRGFVRYMGIDFPVGFELPISVGDNWALTPTTAFTVSVPLQAEVNQFGCVGCAFAVEDFEVGTPLSLWVGLRVQPRLKKADGSKRVSK